MQARRGGPAVPPASRAEAQNGGRLLVQQHDGVSVSTACTARSIAGRLSGGHCHSTSEHCPSAILFALTCHLYTVSLAIVSQSGDRWARNSGCLSWGLQSEDAESAARTHKQAAPPLEEKSRTQNVGQKGVSRERDASSFWVIQGGVAQRGVAGRRRRELKRVGEATDDWEREREKREEREKERQNAARRRQPARCCWLLLAQGPASAGQAQGGQSADLIIDRKGTRERPIVARRQMAQPLSAGGGGGSRARRGEHQEGGVGVGDGAERRRRHEGAADSQNGHRHCQLERPAGGRARKLGDVGRIQGQLDEGPRGRRARHKRAAADLRHRG